MANCLFACDIDNTLIYSRKKPHDGFACVEWIHDEEQAYMSPETIRLMAQTLRNGLLVPVTSRSVEQYLRLRFPDACRPEWAVTTNGARLLHYGEPDPEWHRETLQVTEPCQDELHRLLERYSADERFIRCRIVDDAYLFVYCGRETSASGVVQELEQSTDLSVMPAGKKIYLMPPGLDKAAAVQRLSRRFDAARTISAGDSEMDLPMLSAADRAIMPEALYGQWNGNDKVSVCPGNILFSEFVLQQALRWMEECYD